MPVNRALCCVGFKITTYWGSVPLSCLFGNWIQSLLSAWSTSFLPVTASNRQQHRTTCQSIWSFVAALSSQLSSAQLMVLNCYCFLFISFQPTLFYRREKDIQYRWEEAGSFISCVYCVCEMNRRMCCHYCQRSSRSLWKGKMKGEKWLGEEEGRPIDSNSSWGDR